MTLFCRLRRLRRKLFSLYHSLKNFSSRTYCFAVSDRDFVRDKTKKIVADLKIENTDFINSWLGVFDVLYPT